ncbi:MAG: glycosyltransferase family 2 protein [Terriglobales bacterium]
MVATFWLSFAFLAYTFFGYPLLLWLLSLVRRQAHRRAEIFPTVSLIIAVHNEAVGIARKIENCLELDYPQNLIEILVASDCSQDATASIVRGFAGYRVQLVELPERRGKHHAQMVARDKSRGEILVFSDCSIHLEPDALRKIVSNFADPAIGCVSSEDRVLTGMDALQGEGSYISLEMWLRRLESRVGSLVGASGSFFAARRELCSDWHPGQSSDFFIPLHTAERGLRTVVDPESVGQYGLTRSEKAEFQRKVRTIVHGLDVLFHHLRLLNPFRYGLFSWQLASHKLARWMSPFAAVVLLVASLFLWGTGPLYQAALVTQAVLYLTGLVALAVKLLESLRPFRVASFFLLGNAATLTAWLQFGLGERYVSWEPTHRS